MGYEGCDGAMPMRCTSKWRQVGDQVCGGAASTPPRGTRAPERRTLSGHGIWSSLPCSNLPAKIRSFLSETLEVVRRGKLSQRLFVIQRTPCMASLPNTAFLLLGTCNQEHARCSQSVVTVGRTSTYGLRSLPKVLCGAVRCARRNLREFLSITHFRCR